MTTKQPKAYFGSEIRRLRLGAGMSLRLLARRCGISPVYLSDIENNRKPAPSVTILHALIHVLSGDGEELTRLAMKSLEQYGGTVRKPRLAEQLSTDEYLLVMKKKQMLPPDEFKAWLAITTISNTRNERRIKQQLREIITSRLRHEQPLSLDFDEESHIPSYLPANIPVSSMVLIKHYEGQSEKEALDIFVDTCYREWKSMKTPFARTRYLAMIEESIYVIQPVSLRFLTLDSVLDADDGERR
jgi:transcriptional regulator with XRE-family HTH domain